MEGIILSPLPAAFPDLRFPSQMTVGSRNNTENENQSNNTGNSEESKAAKQRTVTEDTVDGCVNGSVNLMKDIYQNGDHLRNGDSYIGEMLEEPKPKKKNLSTSAAVQENTNTACNKLRKLSLGNLKPSFLGSSLDECDDDATLSAEFTHEEGGTMQKEGSDIILTVPPKAVPRGMTYTVTGSIHRNLSTYNKWMKNANEYIVGPVAEYTVKEGGDFDEHVKISIPHCMNNWRKDSVRVLYGTEQHLKEVSEADGMTYTVNEQYVHILSKHFTRFIVTGDLEQEITDALLTVACLKEELTMKTRVTLRIMLHSQCTRLKDFLVYRKQFYDPDMKEIKRMKVILPDRPEPQCFPKISITATVDEDCTGWAIKDKAEMSREVTREVDGQDVLKLPSKGPGYKSDQLTDFVLEKREGQDEQVSCSVKVAFKYSEQLTQEHILEVVFPTPQGQTQGLQMAEEGQDIRVQGRRKSSLLTNPLREAFKEISKDIGSSFVQLATHLNISQQDWEEVERKYQEPFDRNYHLLEKWRKAAGSEGTIGTLLTALEQCQRMDLAETAQRVYKTFPEEYQQTAKTT